MKYTQIPADTFKQIQLNAGILTDSFIPSTGVIGNLLGATTGGFNFTDSVEYIDFGEDIDNCPKNTKELKKLDSHDVKISGTFVTVTASTAKTLTGAADIDENDTTHIVPRNYLENADFEDIWWIGDYSNENTGENAGFIAIHVFNALNTGGFQIQSTDKAKGQFAFEFTGHYSMASQDVVPFEIFVQQGGGGLMPSIHFNKHSVSIAEGDTETLEFGVFPSDATVTWESEDTNVATVDDGVITAEGAGNTIISASITQDGVTYNDTCTVIVTA